MTRLLVEMGPYSLDLSVDDETDLDGTFDAVDNDTGERLRVNGWLIDSTEEAPIGKAGQ
jgi:hypothetical protein